jgi:N-acetylglutamate synthase-like GNAT family acetyltransferase
LSFAKEGDCSIIPFTKGNQDGFFMAIIIRPFEAKDADCLVEILKLNQQYSYPDVDGPEAMLRVAKCDAAVFLVAETDSRAVGCIRATYDGARAMIHLLSVHPEYQNHGIGTKLVKAAIKELKARGAPTVSVTVTDASKGYWDKLGFEQIPSFLMLKTKI